MRRKVVQFCETAPTSGHAGFTTVLYDDGAMYMQVWKEGQAWVRQSLPDDDPNTIHTGPSSNTPTQ